MIERGSRYEFFGTNAFNSNAMDWDGGIYDVCVGKMLSA